jgi:hypothetical protein
MRLSAKATALATGLLWGGCLLLVGLINLVAPSYGADFLRGMSSVYPGFYHTRNFADVLMGTLYGLIDGAIGGWLLSWLYNQFAGPKQISDVARVNKGA